MSVTEHLSGCLDAGILMERTLILPPQHQELRIAYDNIQDL